MKSRNKILTMIISLSFLLFISVFQVHAEKNESTIDKVEELEYFSETDEQGNVHLYTAEDVLNSDSESLDFDIIRKIGNNEELINKVDTFKEAIEFTENKKKLRSVGEYMIKESSDETKIRNTSPYKVVKFLANVENKNPKPTNVINVDTGHTTSVSWATSRDAAYIGSEGNYHIIMIAGIKGKVLKSDVALIDYDNSLVISKYKTTQGKLYHEITKDMEKSSSVFMGKKPSYLNDNQTYYSYDGHYFYTSYETMINDYSSGNYSHSVNSNNPFYNYYQYLPHRSNSGYTENQLNNFLNSKVNNDKNSKLYNMGGAFISAENTYGANALLMLGVSINESGWGFSELSIKKNNLFGHNASDSDPFANGSVYKTPGDSVKSHAIKYVTQYSDPSDYRHFGSHLGDKQSGMNVYYATDAYWGEKAAQQAYYIEEFLQNNEETGKYQIGITNASINARAEATTQSVSLYKTANKSSTVLNYPIVVLEEVQGEKNSGSDKWYRIKSTSVLTDKRTGLKYDAPDSTGYQDASSNYNFNRDYVYIHSPNIKLIFNGRNMEGYKSGDVRISGTIDSSDLLDIEKHIVYGGNYKLSGTKFNRADVNYDLRIDSKDLLSVEKHIVSKTNKVN